MAGVGSQQGRVPVQDPSMSPTYGMSQPPTTNLPYPSATRRNLFASHLSRRPISASTSQPNSLDPFTNQVPAQRQSSQNDLFRSPPSLQPSHRTINVGIQDTYDPQISPNRPLSPGTTTQYFGASGIVAVSPSTGRAILPSLPKLPPRLRLSEGEEEDEDLESDHENPHLSNHRSPYPSTRTTTEYEGSSSLLYGLRHDYSNPIYHDFLDPSSSDSRDLERIERLLGEMQAQQRAKARAAPTQQDSSENPAQHVLPPNSSVTTRPNRGKGREGAKQTGGLNVLPTSKGETMPPLGGVGATLDPIEKDEILGLIMTSLRKKVQLADEEGWMFGSEVGDGPGGYFGRNEIGTYE